MQRGHDFVQSITAQLQCQPSSMPLYPFSTAECRNNLHRYQAHVVTECTNTMRPTAEANDYQHSIGAQKPFQASYLASL